MTALSDIEPAEPESPAARPAPSRGANDGLERALITTASSIAAVLIALGLAALLLLITGKDAGGLFRVMWDSLGSTNQLLDTLKRATPLMLSAVAVAIGFKMNLFNIGVEGQYFIGAFAGAVLGAEVSLPAPLHVAFVLLVAMAFGGLWALIPAVLKVKRGVNEVIATIMLNAIALAVIQFLFDEYFRDDSVSGLNVKTKLLPESAWMPDIVHGRLSWFFVIALVVVVLYWLLVFKSRFGFRLRASGLNSIAARTSGVSSGRMILLAMAIGGAVAGLVGLQSVLGEIHAYGQGIPDGLGFAGIAVALLGRNHPVGIVVAACLFGFLNANSNLLQLEGIPSSIVTVVQAIIVLTVVIVNEAVSRWADRRLVDRAARRLSLELGGAAA